MTRSPVVAIVCDVIHPYSHGGREIRYHELSRRLAGRADMHVYTMQWWEGPRVRSEGDVVFHAISPLFPLYDGGRRSLKQALLFSLACFRLLFCDFDVIEADHIPYLQVFVLRIVATLKRKRLVVTWHEVWSRSYWRSYLGWFGEISWLLDWIAMQLPDHIIAASPETAERLRKTLWRHSPITVVPNGIGLDTIAAAYADPSATDLVTVGRLIDHKRIDMLLDVIALLHADGVPATCRIIGDGPDRDALHAQAEALGIAHAVEFRHDVAEQKELYSLVKSARVFVSLSDREGFGIAVLEALACGVPVVTTSSPDNLAQHLADRSPLGFVCAPSAASVAATVERLLAGPAVTRDGYDSWLAEYDWDAMADRVARAYIT